MVSSLVRKIKGIQNNWQPSYLRYGCLPIAEKTVLLEGGQGANINGNMFALTKELCQNPLFSEYTPVVAVTKETLPKAKERFARYGFHKVRLVVRNSRAYCKQLATAKYLFTDNTFPPYFHKRQGQVVCNTWHGTPLKTLGFSNKETLRSVNNIQKNFMAADFALFPNEFTQKVFMKDYALEHLMEGESIVANYPRNGVFYYSEQGRNMKTRLGYEGKKLFAYMPTFRDSSNVDAQITEVKTLLKQWDDLLDDTTHLLINLHFVLARELDCTQYKHISYFPKEYETYEVLNACDGLVTDYSSVFFDFAITGKPVVLFAYDKEEYFKNRGVYIPLERLPFPLANTVEEIMNALKNPTPTPQGFLNTFCNNGSGVGGEQLLSRVFSYTVKEQSPKEFGGDLLFCNAQNPMDCQSVRLWLLQHPNRKVVVAYRGSVSAQLLELYREFAEQVTLLGVMNRFQFTPWQRVLLGLEKIHSFEGLQRFYKREVSRLFGGFSFENVVDVSADNGIMAGVLNALQGKKHTVIHGALFPASSRGHVIKKEKALGFAPLSLAEVETRWLKENPGALQQAVETRSAFRPILPVYLNGKNKLHCVSLFTMKTLAPLSMKELEFQVGDAPLTFSCLGGKSKKKRHFGLCRFSLPLEKVSSLPAKNMGTVWYSHPLGGEVWFPIAYCAMPRNVFVGLRGPLKANKQTDTMAVFRQSTQNQLMLYVRSVNVTDSFWVRLQLTTAYLLSLLWHTKKANNLILLYEKNSGKYEESASVLYEELQNQGYGNAYFVINKNSSYCERIPQQYRENVVYQFTFRHFLYFFKAKTFIGTEAIPHALEVKTIHLPALKKVVDKKVNYVFLQHGVMYMVSLNSESRGMFAPKKGKGKYRVVVSSREEANHFIGLGGHLPQQLYITGLPKYDRNTMAQGADKIVIMPTWRPWEVNRFREDFTSTGYFKMLCAMYEHLPKSLQEKAVILPHPLVAAELKKMPQELAEKTETDIPYDDILKQTAVLITDYSSIAYDAFYRGARVIFDWSQKDACMKEYGPSTKLMLHEENVFGDVVTSYDELAQTVLENYHAPQKEEYRKRYARLVEFHDSNNTGRLIACLKQDNLL